MARTYGILGFSGPNIELGLGILHRVNDEVHYDVFFLQSLSQRLSFRHSPQITFVHRNLCPVRYLMTHLVLTATPVREEAAKRHRALVGMQVCTTSGRLFLIGSVDSHGTVSEIESRLAIVLRLGHSQSYTGYIFCAGAVRRVEFCMASR